MMLTAARIRVLLVEPHADTRELYLLGLTTEGFEVSEAHDGASAATAFATDPPTIVVSEMRLPDGNEVALLSRFSSSGVPVVGLTTSPPHLRHLFRPACLAALLIKPCGPDELIAALRVALSSEV